MNFYCVISFSGDSVKAATELDGIAATELGDKVWWTERSPPMETVTVPSVGVDAVLLRSSTATVLSMLVTSGRGAAVETVVVTAGGLSVVDVDAPVVTEEGALLPGTLGCMVDRMGLELITELVGVSVVPTNTKTELFKTDVSIHTQLLACKK